MRESGLIQKWTKNYWPSGDNVCSALVSLSHSQLLLKDMFGTITLLCVGLSFSPIVLLAEILLAKIWKTNDRICALARK